jgi:hypothetical protein
MPSTYTTNNGIELIATGEQSGTWGGTTNTNFELLDTALDGQVSVTLGATGSSGSPNTLPVTDGATSNGRNRLVIFGDGGDLGGTAYVQLTPNNAEKIVYVRNNLSGSRSILLFQGTYSASNDYEIPAGKTAVVFFDGAGSGAVAANVFNNAHFDAMNIVGNVVVGGTVAATGNITTSGTVEPAGDTAAGDNAAIGYTAAEGLILTGQGSTNDVTIKNDADADVLEIPTGTTNVTIAGNLGVGGTVTGTGTSVFASLDISGDIDVDGTTNLDVVDIDGAVDFASTTAHAGNATFADNAKAIFGAGSDLQIYHDGSNSYIQEGGTGQLLIRSEDLRLQDANGTNWLQADTDGAVRLYHNNSNKLATTSAGVDIGGTVTATGTSVFASLDISGVATATTFEPDGDTAAGDNAAIGYTAAEGLILTGQGSTNDVTIKNDADADVLEIPTGTTNVTIAGNLGVGGTITGTGTSVFASLDISGDIDVDGTTNLDGVTVTGDALVSGKIGLDATDYITFTDNTQMDVYINNSNEFRFEADGDFHADGNVIAYSTTISDERLKEDIKPITGALDKVSQLNGYTFTYKADGKESAGVIAQEVEKVLPSAIQESTLPLKTDDGVEYKTVQYDQLHGLLIEAIKELKAEIEELKNASTK